MDITKMIMQEARSVSAAAKRLCECPIPLTQREAELAVLKVMKKGYLAEAGATLLLEESIKLSDRGLKFDNNRIAYVVEM